MSWVVQFLNGISMAAILFLLASGFTLAFGLMRVMNLAHGAYYLLGGYIAIAVIGVSGNFWLALLVAGVVVGVIGGISQRWLISRTMHSELSQVLLTLGFAYIIGDLTLAIWGGRPLRIRAPEWATGGLDVFGLFTYPRYRFVLIAVAVVLGMLLWWLQAGTLIGSAVRAGVDDRLMLGAVGVNVRFLFVWVFAFSAFLAGVAGGLGGALLTVYPGADWEVLVLALVVVIVGGMGSLPGALLGSVFVGVVDAYGRWLFPEWAYVMVFAPMAILLMVRPQGLFGREG